MGKKIVVRSQLTPVDRELLGELLVEAALGLSKFHGFSVSTVHDRISLRDYVVKRSLKTPRVVTVVKRK